MFKKIADILGWVGVALIFGAVLVRFTRPELVTVWRSLVFVGLACAVIYLVGHWREVLGSFSRRQTRLGAFAGLSVLAMVGILVGVNYLAARQNTRWDLTEARQFTLSDQTRHIVRNLEAPTRFLVFARNEEFPRFRDRLEEYGHLSPQLTVEYIDMDRRPAQARQYQVQSYGTIVVEHRDRVERVVSTEEQQITNALIKVVEGREPRVYFTEGHGEKNPTSAERDGYNAIAGELRNENFQVEQLVLAQMADVPEDADVVVVAGPETDFLPGEIEALRRYLNRGGKLLLMLDPPLEEERARLPNLIAFAREWGFEVGHNVVVDASGVGQLIGTDASVPVAATYPSHPITDRFNLLTAYPLARSVGPVENGPEGRAPRTFIETSPRSWAETDIRGLATTGEVSLDPDRGDVPGPVSIGAALSIDAPEAPAGEPTNGNGGEEPETEGQTPQTRVVVVGDSDFAANFALGIQGNRDLFLNVVNWLAEQESLIAIRPREAQDRRLTLTAGQQQQIFWMSVVLIPAAVLGAGAYAWWRRR